MPVTVTPAATVPVTLGSPRFTSREVGGILVTEAYFPPGAELPTHTHERATVALMLQGSFDCVLSGKVLPCGAGALHTEPAQAQHGNRIGSGGARVVVLQPDVHAVGRLGADRSLFDEVQYRPQTAATPLGWRLASELHAHDTAATIATEGVALEFLALLMRDTAAERSSTAMPRWLRHAQDHIHAEFLQPLQLGQLARDLDVSAVRLARAFRRRFGVSIGTYVRQLRLEWARNELRSGDESLAVIASRAGFADQSHFTRMFRRHTGQTPGHFRQVTRR